VLVETARHDRVVVATLNRPDAMNAISAQVLVDVESVLSDAEADDAVGAFVLTGAGEKAFAAGADIAEFRGASAVEARRIAERGQLVTRRLERSRLPVIAAINGYALGGGCEIALACDIRLAAETARLGQPEVTLGVVPGWGGSQRLPAVVGAGVAREMILTGRQVGAEEAHRVGLVNAVYPKDSLLDEAIALGNRIAALPPLAIAWAKELTLAASSADLDTRLEREREVFALTFATEDHTEGVSAFLEKRKGEFRGR
jgi:enoyl-CoA hydratase